MYLIKKKKQKDNDTTNANNIIPEVSTQIAKFNVQARFIRILIGLWRMRLLRKAIIESTDELSAMW